MSLKLIQNFFRNFSFPRCDTDGILENSSSIFSKFQYPGHELDRFLENSSINFCEYLFSFCKISVSVMPQNSRNIIFQLNALFWMSFPEIGLFHAPKVWNWRLDEFSRNRSSSCPRNLSIRVNRTCLRNPDRVWETLKIIWKTALKMFLTNDENES